MFRSSRALQQYVAEKGDGQGLWREVEARGRPGWRTSTCPASASRPPRWLQALAYTLATSGGSAPGHGGPRKRAAVCAVGESHQKQGLLWLHTASNSSFPRSSVITAGAERVAEHLEPTGGLDTNMSHVSARPRASTHVRTRTPAHPPTPARPHRARAHALVGAAV